MVRVPITRLPGQQLRPAALGGFATPQAVPFRSATGSQLQALGGAVQSAGAETASLAAMFERDRQLAEVTEAVNQFEAGNTSDLKHPETGYMNQQGKNAAGEGARKAVMDSIQERRRFIVESLGGDTTKRMFEQASGRIMADVEGRVMDHEARELRAWRGGEADQLAINSIGLAIEARVTPEFDASEELKASFKMHFDTAMAQTDIKSRMLGLGEEMTKAERQQTASDIHVGVVEGLVNESAEQARDYLKDVPKDELFPQDRERLQDAVKRKTLADRTASAALKLIDKWRGTDERAPIPEDPRDFPIGDWGKALGRPKAKQQRLDDWAFEQLEQQFRDGKITDEERKMIWGNVQEWSRHQRESEAQGNQDLLLEVERWGDREENRLKDIGGIDPIRYGKLAERGILDTAQNQLRGRTTSDRTAWLEFMEALQAGELSDTSPAEFFERFKGRMNDMDYPRAQNLLAMTQQPHDPIQTDLLREERILIAAREMHILRRGRTGQMATIERESEQYDKFRKKVERLIQMYEETKLQGQRKVSPEEEQMLLDHAALDWVNVDFAAGEVADERTEFYFGLTEEEEAEATVTVGGQDYLVAEIPKEEVEAITFEILSRGLEDLPTQQLIMEAWVAEGTPGRVRK